VPGAAGPRRGAARERGAGEGRRKERAPASERGLRAGRPRTAYACTTAPGVSSTGARGRRQRAARQALRGGQRAPRPRTRSAQGHGGPGAHASARSARTCRGLTAGPSGAEPPEPAQERPHDGMLKSTARGGVSPSPCVKGLDARRRTMQNSSKAHGGSTGGQMAAARVAFTRAGNRFEREHRRESDRPGSVRAARGAKKTRRPVISRPASGHGEQNGAPVEWQAQTPWPS